jgi:uncharacterized membrane protein YgcG
VLVATISAVAVAVMLLGIPLGLFAGQLVMAGESQRINDRLATLSNAVDRAIERDEQPSDATLEFAVVGREGDLPAHVTISMPDGAQIVWGEPVDGPLIERGMTTPARAGVVMTVSAVGAYIKVAQAVVLVVIAAVVAIGAGVAVAVWQANRLAAPLVYLAASAEQLGSGQVRPRLEPRASRRSTSSPPSSPAAPTGWPGASPPSGSSRRTRRTSCARR